MLNFTPHISGDFKFVTVCNRFLLDNLGARYATLIHTILAILNSLWGEGRQSKIKLCSVYSTLFYFIYILGTENDFDCPSCRR